MVESEVRAGRGAWRPDWLAVVAITGALVAAGTGTALAQPTQTVPGQLDLERAVELAVERNERALIAEKRSEAAVARVARARAFFFPDLTLTASYTRRPAETASGAGREIGPNELQATLSLGLTIFDARSIPLYRQASIDREATDLEARNEKRLIAFDAANAYVSTLGLEQVVAAAERRVEFARQTAADARGRVEAQITSSNDLTRAELERTAAERELTRARAELEAAYLQLGLLLDTEVRGPLVSPDALLASAAATPTSAEALPGTLTDSARTRRLDIVASYKRAQALEAFADEPRARFIPSLGFLGQFRATNEPGFSDRNTDWLLSVNLTWNLWDGGERRADRNERLATAASAEYSARAAERQVTVDVRAALVALSRSQAAVQQSEAVVAAARKNADESAILYREGLVRALEVADASARLFDAEVALARERYGLALALLDLRAVLGFDPLGKEITP